MMARPIGFSAGTLLLEEEVALGMALTGGKGGWVATAQCRNTPSLLAAAGSEA